MGARTALVTGDGFRVGIIDLSPTDGGRVASVTDRTHVDAAGAAVNGLTKSLAPEYGPRGTTVNAVPPGFLDTPMLRSAESRHLLGGTVQDHIKRTPVRQFQGD